MAKKKSAPSVRIGTKQRGKCAACSAPWGPQSVMKGWGWDSRRKTWTLCPVCQDKTLRIEEVKQMDPTRYWDWLWCRCSAYDRSTLVKVGPHAGVCPRYGIGG